VAYIHAINPPPVRIMSPNSSRPPFHGNAFPRLCPGYQRSAFTLVELLAVLAIIAVLAWLAAGAVASFLEKGKMTQSASNLKQIGVAASLWGADNNNSLLPLRMERNASPPGMWYDHLHEYLGRARGRDGRYVNGVRVNLPIYSDPLQKKIYAINYICGRGDNTSGLDRYLKRGQGVLPNDQSRVYHLPGGLSKTAWFSTGLGEGFASEFEHRVGEKNRMAFPYNNQALVLFMDGSVRPVPNPDFIVNPNLRREPKWVEFFGYFTF
jgi:prepilin-type N-terminal cleavage/methylation domain-containing protein